MAEQFFIVVSVFQIKILKQKNGGK
jgi:hypothetical protein